MFRRGFFGLGAIQSDEGFSISLKDGIITYKDDHGEIWVPFENGEIFTEQLYIAGSPSNVVTDVEDRNMIADRVLRAMEWDGKPLRIALLRKRASFDEE
jgi:hypothetical protein